MDAWKVLDVSREADDEEIRAAYLRKVKEHPPDRSPVEFERIRDAYDILRDPRRRMHDALFDCDPFVPLGSAIRLDAPPRKFVGPQPWLEALKRK